MVGGKAGGSRGYQLQPVPSAYVWDAGVVAQLRQEGAQEMDELTKRCSRLKEQERLDVGAVVHGRIWCSCWRSG